MSIVMASVRLPVSDDSTDDAVSTDDKVSSDEAFERYVLPEVEILLRVARSLTRNHADAEDLVQDTLIRAYRAIDRFDGRHPRAWLLTILRNTHINRNRRRRPELLRDPDSQLERLTQSSGDRVWGDDSSDRPDQFIDSEFDVEVEAALRSLSVTFGQVIELVDIQGLSYAEAAEAAGVPIGTVMSRLHRGRKRIREHLRKVGVSPTYDDVQAGRPRL
jgi:RNA polymerase sigma-70 factor (ECF subfamily)